MRFRAIVFSVLISLPAVLVVGGGAAYVALNVPGWIRAEPGRITREYREHAERLHERTETATSTMPRQRGWRMRGRVSGNAWGYVPEGGRIRVWVLNGPGVCLSDVVDAVHPVPYALIFYWGGSVVALVLIVLN